MLVSALKSTCEYDKLLKLPLNLLGQCLHAVGVNLTNGIDEQNRPYFSVFNPAFIVNKYQVPEWFKAYSRIPPVNGINSYPTYPVSFHYMEPNNMNFVEFLLYKMKIFNLNDNDTDDY